ncbi:hypothetical protein MJ588_13595 [Klebsiella pneumoniae]|nr:hypothetical protein MJ588_13595 [Klebsiella pneumoniae]
MRYGCSKTRSSGVVWPKAVRNMTTGWWENRDRAYLLARGWLLSWFGGQRRLEHQQRQRPEDNDAHPVH